MKKIVLFAVALVALNLNHIFAQCSASVGSGSVNWTALSFTGTGCSPLITNNGTYGNNVTISGIGTGDVLNVNLNLTINGNLTINATGSNPTLRVKSGFTLFVNGNLVNSNNNVIFFVEENAKLIVTGTLNGNNNNTFGGTGLISGGTLDLGNGAGCASGGCPTISFPTCNAGGTFCNTNNNPSGSSCTGSQGGTISPSNATICNNTSPGSLTLSGHNGLIIRWERSTNNSTWTSVSNTTTTYNPGNLTSTTYFRAVISPSGASCVAYSSTTTVTVSSAAPTISTQPQSLTRCLGASASFSVVAAGAPSYTYQWRKNGNNISGATASTYTISSTVAGDFGANYSVVVTNSCSGGGSVTSNNASLTQTTSNTWLGGSSSWATSSNWSCGIVPTSAIDVTIPNTANQPVTATSSSTSVKNLIIQSGASLTTGTSSMITVSGNFNNSGTFTSGLVSASNFSGTFTNSGTFNSGASSASNLSNGMTNSGTVSLGENSAFNIISGDFGNSGTFNGGNNTAISLTGNWTNTGTFNPSTSNVTFNIGSNRTLVKANNTETFYKLTKNGSATLTIGATTNMAIAAGGNIDVQSGTFNFNSRTVTLRSSFDGSRNDNTASISKVNGSITNASNLVVELPVYAFAASRMYSTPVIGASIQQFRDSVRISGPQAGGFDAPYLTNNSTFRYYLENKSTVVSAGFEPILDASQTLVPTRGYSVLFAFKQNGTSIKTETTKINLKGSLIQGNQSFNFLTYTPTKSNGWNLVGNPYACPIDWNAASGWSKTNISNQIDIWDASKGAYISVVGSVASDGRTNGNIIPIGQAFFIKANASAPVLQINENAKSLSRGKTNFREEKQNQFVFKATNGEMTDYSNLILSTQADDDFSLDEDAEKRPSEFSISSIVGEKHLSINQLNQSGGSKLVSMLLEAETSDAVNLTLEEANLEDFEVFTNLNGSWTSLGINQNLNVELTNGKKAFDVLIVSKTTSLADALEEINFGVFPNPTNNGRVNVSNLKGGERIVLRDLSGVEIISQNNGMNNIVTLNVESLKLSGIYILEIKSQKNSHIRKVVFK
ncbi:MAG: T9SS type A sorting domain-containing protein [Cytophagales bacterium]